MKRNLLGMVVAICALSVVLISCKNNTDVLPQPPYLTVQGLVTDGESQPLSSIQVTILLPDSLFPAGTTYSCWTDEKGQYMSDALGCWAIETGVSWPTEITVSAKDTLGIYEEQTKKVSVVAYPRYPDGQLPQYIDAKATADFVLQKVTSLPTF